MLVSPIVAGPPPPPPPSVSGISMVTEGLPLPPTQGKSAALSLHVTPEAEEGALPTRSGQYRWGPWLIIHISYCCQIHEENLILEEAALSMADGVFIHAILISFSNTQIQQGEMLRLFVWVFYCLFVLEPFHQHPPQLFFFFMMGFFSR
jgi:hypothetical protein